MSDSFAALRAARLGQAFEDVAAFQAMDVFQIPLRISKAGDYEGDSRRQNGSVVDVRHNQGKHAHLKPPRRSQNAETVGVQTDSEPPPVFNVLLIEATGQDEREEES